MMKNIKKSFNFEIEISGTDKEISELKGIGFDAEVFNENSFDDYFEIEKNQIEPNKFIFSISQKKKDKTSIKDLSSKLFDEIVSRFKCKDKLILKNRENNRGITFIDFCFHLKIFSDSNDLINKNKGKDTINDKAAITSPDKAVLTLGVYPSSAIAASGDISSSQLSRFALLQILSPSSHENGCGYIGNMPARSFRKLVTVASKSGLP